MITAIINFNANIGNTDDFKSFKYNTKLAENTEADNGNGILKMWQLLFH